jgi:hypothetical protein
MVNARAFCWAVFHVLLSPLNFALDRQPNKVGAAFFLSLPANGVKKRRRANAEQKAMITFQYHWMAALAAVIISSTE